MKTFTQFVVLGAMFTVWGLAIAAGLLPKKGSHD